MYNTLLYIKYKSNEIEKKKVLDKLNLMRYNKYVERERF